MDGGAPVLLAAPSVSGDPQVGAGDSEQGRLTAGEGRWTNAPDGYAYEWLRCPADNQTEALCTDTGQRGKTYQVTAADLGTPLGANVALRVRVTATVTGKGANVALSAPTPPVHT